MKSLQHVLWRGALALGLMAVGVGSGIGMPPTAALANAEVPECTRHTRVVVVHGARTERPGGAIATAFVAGLGAVPVLPES